MSDGECECCIFWCDGYKFSAWVEIEIEEPIIGAGTKNGSRLLKMGHKNMETFLHTLWCIISPLGGQQTSTM